MTRHRFVDRREAGIELARTVSGLALHTPVIVLALPRGGVPVAYEVARALRAPLDVLVARKIGMPGQPELAIGAIAPGGIIVQDTRVAAPLELDARTFACLAEREQGELKRRERTYRSGRSPLALAGQTVVLVDDGIATGATMLAALRAARKAGAASIIVAAPVASSDAAALLEAEADELAVLTVPEELHSIGEWYLDFAQIEDAEVCTLLEKTQAEPMVSA
jgi:putative phosphoribosyl transferase